jgi:V/A-type H+/Na+-transporting ATPase subunit D
MPQTTLNKSSLQKEHEKLALYNRLLPSLDLKRRQLTLELGRARKALETARQALQEIADRTVAQLPMVAGPDRSFAGIVRLESVDLAEENVVGVRLPVLEKLTWTVSDYSLLGEPPWVDVLVERVRQVGEQQQRVAVHAERVRRLEKANRRITQRINLFQEILIPDTEKNIRRIRIVLGDAEMSAVVRSKIAKALHEKKHRKAGGMS